MNRALTARDSSTRAALRGAFEHLGYEVIPFKKTEEQVLENVPKDVRLTVTASPAKTPPAGRRHSVRTSAEAQERAVRASSGRSRCMAHLPAWS